MARDASSARTVAPETVSEFALPIAGLLAWMVPGLGHWYLGLRTRAMVFLVFISVTFWAGVAVGGVKSTVHPSENGAWFAAQLCMGTQALGAWGAGKYVERTYGRDTLAYTAYWPSDNIAVIYSGIAGLLNLLVIIDALARADTKSVQLLSRPPPVGGKS